jgi:predicted RecA/RadA family phage recombinase
MIATFKQRGDVINHVPTSDVSAGDVVVQEDLLGIAKLDIKANMLGALALTGVFAMPKATGTGEAIAAGVKLYWDAANLLATADDASGTNKFLGKAILAASDTDETVQVRLSQ